MDMQQELQTLKKDYLGKRSAMAQAADAVAAQYEKMGNFAKALAWYTRAGRKLCSRENTPDNRGDKEAAEQYYQKVFDLYERHPEVQESGKAFYEEALLQMPQLLGFDYNQAHTSRGKLRYGTWEFDLLWVRDEANKELVPQALDYLQAALDLQGEHAAEAAYAICAICQHHIEGILSREEAKEHVKNSLETIANAGYDEAWLDLGNAYIEDENLPKALECFEKTYQRGGEPAKKAAVRLAEIYELQGNRDKALEVYPGMAIDVKFWKAFGDIYREGHYGVKVNYKKARDYYLEAYNSALLMPRKNKNGLQNVARRQILTEVATSLSKLYGVRENDMFSPEQEVYWLDIVERYRDTPGRMTIRLADLHLEGYGCQKDAQRAKELYQKVANYGLGPIATLAQKKLDKLAEKEAKRPNKKK